MTLGEMKEILEAEVLVDGECTGIEVKVARVQVLYTKC